jgi:hypothetical protein
MQHAHSSYLCIAYCIGTLTYCVQYIDACIKQKRSTAIEVTYCILSRERMHIIEGILYMGSFV